MVAPIVVHADNAVPLPECINLTTPKFTFSVVDDETKARFEAFYQADIDDDGTANWDARWYLAHLSHLPVLEPENLVSATFVVYRWFPHEYIQGADNAPAIRVFLRQEPLINAAGVLTSEAPKGAVVFLPMHGQATDAETAAAQFVTHVCGLRAKLHGEVVDI